MTSATRFPFTAIVGQQDMKDALLVNAVDPGIGGVLIAGTRGTAKSTAVRSLADLLPPIRAVADCPYHCPPTEPTRQCDRCRERSLEDGSATVEQIRTPFVNLPIGATEDRVLGSIDLETAITEGERRFEPGLLARANRGVLYVDEVNLLPDHLVDVLLDAVASGTNRVEREGVSFEHPAEVLLVGTMNPEEGELRPQLLDRFGLYVEMDRELTPPERKAVVRRRAAFERDPEAMLEEWREDEAVLADRLETARARLPEIDVGEECLDRIVSLCIEHDVDGLRADIVIHRTARALAALDGASRVSSAHVTRAAELALGHRTRSDPPSGGPDPDPPRDGDGSDHTPADDSAKPPRDELPDLDPATDGTEGEQPDGDANRDGSDEAATAAAEAAEEVYPVASGAELPEPSPSPRGETDQPTDDAPGTGPVAAGPGGAHYGSKHPSGQPQELALDATIRAAAPHQEARAAEAGAELALRLRPSDLREKRRQRRARRLIVFVVDASGSMGAYDRMGAVKGAILSRLERSYQRREMVSLIGFRGDRAETILEPTAGVDRAAKALSDLPTGGRTPLAAGLERALDTIESARRQEPGLSAQLVLLTDGRPNVADGGNPPVESALVQGRRVRAGGHAAACFDTETGPVRVGIARELATAMGADYHRFDDLDPSRVSAAIRDVFSLGAG